ncbi:MAG: ABC transporter ATP-binding protein, partial [bacterium]
DQPILHAENLKKYYNDRLVLDIPYLDFETGRIYALVGPNGSGKTTLLKILNLLEQPTEGKLYFDGHKINKDIINIRRQMAFVLQDTVLFRTTVYKNVAYGLKVRSVDKKIISSMVFNALNMLGLAGFENRKARQLSAGEAKRVALARALVLKPRVLLLDEPTANIDKQNVQVFETLLKKINVERRTTTIFTTHDLSQAYRLADKVIFLLNGKIIDNNRPINLF